MEKQVQKAENRKERETSIECYDEETSAKIYKDQEAILKYVKIELDTHTSWVESPGEQSSNLNSVGNSASENANDAQ